MPRVIFRDKFDWTPEKAPNVTIAFRAGCEYLVTRACAAEAIAKGKAILKPEFAAPVAVDVPPATSSSPRRQRRTSNAGG